MHFICISKCISYALVNAFTKTYKSSSQFDAVGCSRCAAVCINYWVNYRVIIGWIIEYRVICSKTMLNLFPGLPWYSEGLKWNKRWVIHMSDKLQCGLKMCDKTRPDVSSNPAGNLAANQIRNNLSGLFHVDGSCSSRQICASNRGDRKNWKIP